MQIKHGLLHPAKFIASPNYDARPENTDIDLLVIHCISLPRGEFDNHNIEALFLNKINPQLHPSFKELANLKVSAHLVIYRDGAVVQFVPFHARAWHAGVSCFQGKNNCNDFSIGIELEGTDDADYLPIQYEKLIVITKLLCQTYRGIIPERIVGHSEIAGKRKTDPGLLFDWSYYKQQVFGDTIP